MQRSGARLGKLTLRWCDVYVGLRSKVICWLCDVAIVVSHVMLKIMARFSFTSNFCMNVQ